MGKVPEWTIQDRPEYSIHPLLIGFKTLYRVEKLAERLNTTPLNKTRSHRPGAVRDFVALFPGVAGSNGRVGGRAISGQEILITRVLIGPYRPPSVPIRLFRALSRLSAPCQTPISHRLRIPVNVVVWSYDAVDTDRLSVIILFEMEGPAVSSCDAAGEYASLSLYRFNGKTGVVAVVAKERELLTRLFLNLGGKVRK